MNFILLYKKILEQKETEGGNCSPANQISALPGWPRGNEPGSVRFQSNPNPVPAWQRHPLYAPPKNRPFSAPIAPAAVPEIYPHDIHLDSLIPVSPGKL